VARDGPATTVSKTPAWEGTTSRSSSDGALPREGTRTICAAAVRSGRARPPVLSAIERLGPLRAAGGLCPQVERTTRRSSLHLYPVGSPRALVRHPVRRSLVEKRKQPW